LIIIKHDKNMKNLLRWEELAKLAFAWWLSIYSGYSWWLFAACILLPDLSMIGYAINTRAGALMYNFFHHQGVAILAGLCGFYLHQPWLEFTGILLFGHSAMDRIFGYGLKYADDFKHTHLGWIGPEKTKEHS
jgi:hypothetical protein